MSAVPQPTTPPPVPLRANVLLVDDRADKLIALESTLADGDHRVVTARSGAEALRALLREDFAVILLDVSMPQLDGFQTAKLIRGRDRSQNTPIIFMTALADIESEMLRGYSLGAVDFIQLPVDPVVLKAKVSVFVELYRRLEVETRRNRFFTLAPDMLGIAGLDGRMRHLNQSWEDALGISPEELCARPSYEFLHPEDQAPMREQLRRLADGAPRARFENRHRHADGSYRWLAWTAAPFREEGLVYVFVRDITFRKVAEEERLQLVREQEARRAAERENEIKDHFLATLSHELRSPLTPILGWTSMLRSGHLGPAETPRALEVIERNARLQARLIDDLLDVSRIVSGKLRLDPRPIDVRGVFEAGLEPVRAAAGQRGIQLSLALGAEPLYVMGDPQRLQQVVWNLATNAVKFSSRGGRVRVTLERAGDAALLRVCDDGIGISAEFLPHVFDRFLQASVGTTRSHGGLGLGLPIVRHIVEAHGGSVIAESEGLERGACFSVLLPCAGEAALLGPEGDLSAAEADLRAALAGRTVLVVDDEADVRDVLRAALEEHGARVLTASSTAEAVMRFESERPDVLVSDIGMPGSDGYMLAERLKLRSPGATPAIALTAYASREDSGRAFAAGFRLHLPKPVDAALVARSVAEVLRV
jgi:PAS domain S-box-containing protein